MGSILGRSPERVSAAGLLRYWRPIIERSVTAYLRCGDLHEGFARVRCGDCGHEMSVAFSVAMTSCRA